MKLYNISSPEKFLRKVLSCTGRAYCVQSGGQPTDLKELARFLINSGMANQLDGIREIDLRLENQDDAVMLMDFAAQMNCHNRVA